MTDRQKNQKSFISMFVLIVVADLMARIALATGDDVWEHLSMLWLGPLDDVFFALVGIQAFLYMLDPSGEKTLDEKGAHNHHLLLKAFQTGSEKELAVNFVRGSRFAFLALPVVLVSSLVAVRLVTSPASRGALSFAQQHLSYIFPVSLAVVFLFALLRLGESTSRFWKCAALSAVCLLAAAALDGRWQNHLYHLVANLENIQAWTVAFAWAGFFAAVTEEK
jgi:hypothetical protein